jgi:hypothetical protein
MVTARAPMIRDHAGKSRISCLIWLLVAAVGIYIGIGVGTVYLQYWRLLEDMRTQARVAPSIDNVTIQRRLLQTIDALNLPPEARRLTIRRTTRPREIVIRTEYQRTLNLLVTHYTVTFRPEARAPL